jgi:hypothetical protein
MQIHSQLKINLDTVDYLIIFSNKRNANYAEFQIYIGI